MVVYNAGVSGGSLDSTQIPDHPRVHKQKTSQDSATGGVILHRHVSTSPDSGHRTPLNVHSATVFYVSRHLVGTRPSLKDFPSNPNARTTRPRFISNRN